MIYYDRKYAMKRIWLTWRKKELEVVGIYEFAIKNKDVIKLYKQPSPKYILELETTDGKYGGMLLVGAREYEIAKKGAIFGKCTLIQHKKERNYYIIAKSPIPRIALKKVTMESKICLFILLLIILDIILSVVLFSKL